MATPTSPTADRGRPGRPGIENVRRGFLAGLGSGDGFASFLGREAAALVVREVEAAEADAGGGAGSGDAAEAGGDGGGERGWGLGWERDCSPMDGGRGGGRLAS